MGLEQAGSGAEDSLRALRCRGWPFSHWVSGLCSLGRWQQADFDLGRTCVRALALLAVCPGIRSFLALCLGYLHLIHGGDETQSVERRSVTCLVPPLSRQVIVLPGCGSVARELALGPLPSLSPTV